MSTSFPGGGGGTSPAWSVAPARRTNKSMAPNPLSANDGQREVICRMVLSPSGRAVTNRSVHHAREPTHARGNGRSAANDSESSHPGKILSCTKRSFRGIGSARVHRQHATSEISCCRTKCSGRREQATSKPSRGQLSVVQ